MSRKKWKFTNTKFYHQSRDYTKLNRKWWYDASLPVGRSCSCHTAWYDL